MRSSAWWRHQMEAFSALLALCVVNSPVTGEFPAQRPVTRSFGVFFDLRLNKRLSKQSLGWWFETPSHPLWRQCYGMAATLREVSLRTQALFQTNQFKIFQITLKVKVDHSSLPYQSIWCRDAFKVLWWWFELKRVTTCHIRIYVLSKHRRLNSSHDLELGDTSSV